MIQRLSQAAERASSWLWLRREEKSWKLSTSTLQDRGATNYQIYTDKARNIYDGDHHADDEQTTDQPVSSIDAG